MLLSNEAQMTIPHDHHPIYKLFPGKGHKGRSWNCMILYQWYVKSYKCSNVCQTHRQLFVCCSAVPSWDLNKSFVETASFFLPFYHGRTNIKSSWKGKNGRVFPTIFPIKWYSIGVRIWVLSEFHRDVDGGFPQKSACSFQKPWI